MRVELVPKLAWRVRESGASSEIRRQKTCCSLIILNPYSRTFVLRLNIIAHINSALIEHHK